MLEDAVAIHLPTNNDALVEKDAAAAVAGRRRSDLNDNDKEEEAGNDDDDGFSSSSLPSPSSLTAATVTPTPPPLCKHWERRKMCLYHNKGMCKFDHPPDYQPQPPLVCLPVGSNINNIHNIGLLQQQQRRRRHRAKGGKLRVRNDNRAAIFRSFIASRLLGGSGADDDDDDDDNPLSSARILDVAGGKGELAFQFLNLCNVASCHVVDPRPFLSLKRFRTMWERGLYHRSAKTLYPEIVVPQPNDGNGNDDKNATPLLREVGHLRCLFTEELWLPSTTTTTTEDGGGIIDDKDKEEDNSIAAATAYAEKRFRDNCQATQAWSWPPKGSLHSSGDHSSSSNIQEEGKDHDENEDTTCAATNTANTGQMARSIQQQDEKEEEEQQQQPRKQNETPLPTLKYASDVTRKATLIVGIHPDQAVDAIVDAALALEVSFFVVPCCVYSRAMSFRKLGDNQKPVTSYEELLDYLQNKHPDIQREVLPFEGKNVCLFRIVGRRTKKAL